MKRVALASVAAGCWVGCAASLFAGTYTWGSAASGDWSTGWSAADYPDAAGDAAVVAQDITNHAAIAVDAPDAMLAALVLNDATHTYTVRGPHALTFACTNAGGFATLTNSGTHAIGAEIRLANPLRIAVPSNGELAITGAVYSLGPDTNANYIGNYGGGLLRFSGSPQTQADLVAAGSAGTVRAPASALEGFRRIALHGGVVEVVGGGTITRSLSAVSDYGVYWGYVNDGYGGTSYGGFAAIGGALTIRFNDDANNDLLIQIVPGTDGYGNGLMFNSPHADSPTIIDAGINAKSSTGALSLGGDRVITILDNPASDGDYVVITGDTPLNGRHLNKYGPGLLIFSHQGAQGQRHPLGVRQGELRLHSDFSYMREQGSWIQVFDGATLSGHGILPELRADGNASTCWISPGGGQVAPATGIMTATNLANVAQGMSFRFEFTRPRPVLTNRTDSGNDVLRLTSAAPFDSNLAAGTNALHLYLNVDVLRTGSYRGGFWCDRLTPEQLLAAIGGADCLCYGRHADGDVRFNGVRYSLLDPEEYPVAIGVAAEGTGAIAVFDVYAPPESSLIMVR